MNIPIKKKALIALVVILLGASIWKPMFGGWHRPYINESPWDLAQYLAENNKPASECFDLIWWEIMSPSQAVQRAGCVHEYAKLTKDPSACELLMPSSYGWDCLGAAKEPNARMCWFDFGKNAKKIGENTMPECGGSPDLADQCCVMATKLFVDRVSSCDEFLDLKILHNQCLEELAHREKDIELCAEITNDHVRATCEVTVRALLNN